MPISSLSNALSLMLGRPVINRTGLSGRFDFEVDYVPMAISGTLTVDDPDRVSIFTAIQEQLGLRLHAEDVAIEVLVIDGIHRPSPD